MSAHEVQRRATGEPASLAATDQPGSPLRDAEPRTSAPAFGRLVRAEFRRLAARRFTRIVIGLGLLGYLLAVGLIWHSHSRVTAADIAQATAQRDQQITAITAEVNQCKKQAGTSQEAQCGEPPSAEQFPIDQFLHDHPFDPGHLNDDTLAVGVAISMLAFLLGATFIGAEWSSKNLIAWLFWEPRRLRLMAAKLLALLSSVLVLSAVAQAIWFGTAKLLVRHRGLPVSTLGPLAAHFWRHVIDAQARAALLVLITALIGYSLASLLRNSAAALGVAFVYFAVVESLIRSLNPNWQPYLFTTNIAAWVSDAGVIVQGKSQYSQQDGYVLPKEILVSNSHGGVVLLVFAGLATVAALVVFARRDIS